ncbi:MAG: CotH kinase family protein, partial [Myxococcota bacterium]|nr:CotH kinase family protein [Myxococcota bacterium]
HVYHDPVTDRFVFLPWGIDALFDRDPPFGDDNPTSVTARGAVAHRLYLHPEGQARYVTRMNELLDTVWDADAIDDEIERMEGLVEPLLRPGEEEWFHEGIATLRDVIAGREDAIRAELDDGPPLWSHGMNEFSCLSPVGELSCTFETTWNSTYTDDPYGTGAMEVLWFDDPIPVQEVYSWTAYDPVETEGRVYVGLPGLMGYPEEYIYPQLLFSPTLVQSNTQLAVDWNEVQAYVYYIAPSGEASMMAYGSNGTLTLDQAEPVNGAPFTGSVTFELLGWGD